MGKKGKKRKGVDRRMAPRQKGISDQLRNRTAEIEYVLRCTFVPMENRTAEGVARLGEAIYRDKIA